MNGISIWSGCGACMLPRYRIRFVVCRAWLVGILALVVLECPTAIPIERDETVLRQLAEIAQVGPQGTGSAEARKAREELAAKGVEILPPLLTAMNTRNVVAANWYRLIFDDIVERGLARSDTIWPLMFLKEYVSDSQVAGRPRTLVLNLLERLDPTFRAGWLPTRLADPDFRNEAVAVVLAAGEQALRDGNPEHARAEFRRAFTHALDSIQVTSAAQKLVALGEEADIAAHLGLVTDWWLVGPFDAPGKTGFATVFPPERQIDLKKTFVGQNDRPISWIRHHSPDSLGLVDLNSVLGPTREAVGYAYTEIDVPEVTPAHLRCGADDNCAVWLNGRQVFAREQWLNGTRFDRFITPVTLVTGRNTVLVKVCQGPQHKDPEVSNNWSLQLRFCNADGKGIGFTSVKIE